MAGMLEGKVCVITGAASGIGAESARLFADRGATVVGVDVAEGAVGELALAADVTDEAAVNEVFAKAAAELEGIDAVILSAGIGRYGAIESYPVADWEATIATNLTGPFLCAKAAIPYLRARGGGAIIAVSSGAGKQGYPQLGAYSASKFGLMGLMQGLAAEVADDGIKVCTVVPGSILTPFGGLSVAEKRDAMASDPGRKYLYPEDVAEAILFLLRQPRHAWTQELNLWPF
jgi:NAD(P)-dependent dehydrogenase (short-subunit alcohol dehydrogenase family)